ncbi:restriction endonuclease subunit S [Succinivibrio dextrinosolvens]|uniref:restriction endonuclease subunit S n=1 Tax=Succinivibrio dextrinosolvens TaxID=83771 RepID=UPI002479EF16|nr:restriction endonuclease subunit S [Succinivibrio dextrinosolvens]
MSEEKRIPKLRFPEFTDDWEQRKLSDLGEIVTGSTPSTSHPEYYSEDGIPWVTPSDINSNTIGDTPRKLSKLGESVVRIVPEETILVTCIASIGKNTLLLKKGSFNQQINGLIPNKEIVAPYFLLTESSIWSEEMKRSAAAATMQIVNKKDFSNIKTYVPCKQEQEKIGQFFQKLDNLITLHQRKLETTQKLKQGFLQKLFPQKGKKIPELRFPEFTGDWEQRKLVDVVDSIDTGKSKFNKEGSSGEYPILGSTSVIGYDDEYDYEGDFILTARVGANAGSLYRHAGKVKISDNTVFIRSSQNIDFIYHLLTRFDIKKLSFGTGQPLVKASELKKLELMMPIDFNEQIKIGSFFLNLDNLITLHQRKLEIYQNIKKGLLQQMFV